MLLKILLAVNLVIEVPFQANSKCIRLRFLRYGGDCDAISEAASLMAGDCSDNPCGCSGSRNDVLPGTSSGSLVAFFLYGGMSVDGQLHCYPEYITAIPFNYLGICSDPATPVAEVLTNIAEKPIRLSVMCRATNRYLRKTLKEHNVKEAIVQ